MKLALIRLILLLVGTLLLFACGMAQTATNVGTDFWIAFPPNYGSSTLQIFISSNTATTGYISSAYPGINQAFSVSPGLLTQITLPTGLNLTDGIEDKGIHITSVDSVAVYGLNRLNASTDAYMALPTPSLGLDYRILSYTVSYGPNASCLCAVATQNGTNLSVYNHQTNSTSNISLNQGQTYLLKASINNEDLTGSTVQSNFPVAVYGSIMIATVPATCTAADHLIEQMPPVTAWGKEFVTVPTAGRNNSGDVFRILANEDATEVSINGSLVASIDAGDFYETDINGNNAITSTKPTLVAQYAKGVNCSGGTTGDPFMMLIPPREQFLTNYTIGTVAGFNSHWVNVVAHTNSVGSIYEDGVLIPTSAFTPIGTTGYYGAQRSVSEGTHTYVGSNPFGVFSYGWNFADSYGYSGGCSLSQVATVTNVSLSPETSTGILEQTSLCFTAHVANGSGVPVSGVLVKFMITGLNALVGNAYTDDMGNALYCYTQTGVIPGTDNIVAEVSGNVSNTVAANWNLPGPCINPTDGGSIGTDQLGCPGYDPSLLTNITLPSGESGTLEYQWQLSTVSSSAGFVNIPGGKNLEYNPDPISQTTWYRRLAKVTCAAGWIDAAASNVVQVTDATPAPTLIKHN
jgi:hypothetical protein